MFQKLSINFRTAPTEDIGLLVELFLYNSNASDILRQTRLLDESVTCYTEGKITVLM